MGELKKLVEEDKGKYIGLSVQMAWSLWTRDIEDDTVPLCRLVLVLLQLHMSLEFSNFS